jgi:hypothetical protein
LDLPLNVDPYFIVHKVSSWRLWEWTIEIWVFFHPGRQVAIIWIKLEIRFITDNSFPGNLGNSLPFFLSKIIWPAELFLESSFDLEILDHHAIRIYIYERWQRAGVEKKLTSSS